MKKKIVAITLATIIALGFPVSNYSYAETTNDLEAIQDQRKEIKENLSDAEGQIASVVVEIEELNNQIEKVNERLIESRELIRDTEQDITVTIDEIETLQSEKQELEISIEKRYEILKNRVSSYQRTGGSISFLEVIFGSQNFGDFLSRVSSVNKIAESDAILMEELDVDIKKVEENQKLSLEKLDKLNSLKQEQEEARLAINEQKQQNEAHKQELENKQQELVALVGNLQAKDSNLTALEAETKEKIAEAARAAALAAKEREQIEKSAVKVATTSSETKQSEEEASTNKSTGTKQQSNKAVKQEQEKQVQEVQEPVEKSEGKTLMMSSTAYTVESSGGSGVTSTGIDLRENPDTKVIAVDPSVIPLGTVVHVEGYGYAIAGDIGGAIKGNKIDVYVPTQKAALNWGRRTVKVTFSN
ncbi:PcsB-like coiled-coil domain-containing protein [Oceanobacillus chungangensis]|uniref:Uncharacterized protein n=1 Tax=Oceanobacillus chungangensis TaxID=1229152 RepID=A0A3D8PKW9_9BACI|nr:3D domain-containing protein [Oceanobacillus chungangensis]RDW15899.1 hypothetical protein CWR45_15485 [Oceanobacillus chungangensis]